MVEANRGVKDRNKENVNEAINLHNYDGFIDEENNVQITVLFDQKYI